MSGFNNFSVNPFLTKRGGTREIIGLSSATNRYFEQLLIFLCR